jgi:L-alanine-DL-glutamate epimerase-like enolase superfamily enzyme
MKITAVRVRKVVGVLSTDGPFWEERLVRPVDIYPRYRAEQWLAEYGEQLDVRRLRIEAFFLTIETDEGVSGLAGPFRAPCAQIVATQLRPILLGQDARASEYLWDVMHRLLVHGRQGEAMFAISVVDCALWDLKGKWLGQPVWRLLGGPTRTEIPAYASMLGYAVLDPGLVRERALMAKEQGFRAQKWFFRHGPMSGHEGLRKNVELIRTLRETLGEDYDIMLDCWQSFDYRSMLQLAQRIEEYRPYWLEETVMPDRIDSYRRLRDKLKIPLAGAEHDYTRWGMKRFIDAGALDIYQPDPYWCGGLSETLKIGALTTTHDLICIPHGHSTQVNTVFSVLQSPIHTPYQEYLVKWNEVHQFWFAEPQLPKGGMIHLTEAPGLCPALDESRIDASEEF